MSRFAYGVERERPKFVANLSEEDRGKLWKLHRHGKKEAFQSTLAAVHYMLNARPAEPGMVRNSGVLRSS